MLLYFTCLTLYVTILECWVGIHALDYVWNLIAILLIMPSSTL